MQLLFKSNHHLSNHRIPCGVERLFHFSLEGLKVVHSINLCGWWGHRERERQTIPPLNVGASGTKVHQVKLIRTSKPYKQINATIDFLHIGIICAEGPLWKDQRKLISGWLKSFGMSKHSISREKLEKRIADGVHELLEVRLANML